MYVAECTSVPFDEACRVLEQGAGRIVGAASRSLLAKSTAQLRQMEAGPLVRISADVACLALRWCGSATGAPLEKAELRIVRVESGRDPVTEILGIVSSGRSGTTLRGFLEEIVAQLEREAVA